MGGNAVFAYHQAFDIEGDSGMIARGYGTACKIVRASKSNVIESQRLLTAAIRDAENQRNQHHRRMILLLILEGRVTCHREAALLDLLQPVACDLDSVDSMGC